MMYALRFDDLATRSRFIDHLGTRDIMAVFHYQPLRLSAVGERRGQHPVTERAAETPVRLFLFGALTDGEIDHIIESVTSSCA